jgi:hypothetical protein
MGLFQHSDDRFTDDDDRSVVAEEGGHALAYALECFERAAKLADAEGYGVLAVQYGDLIRTLKFSQGEYETAQQTAEDPDAAQLEAREQDIAEAEEDARFGARSLRPPSMVHFVNELLAGGRR